MTTLSSELRNKLERTCIAARSVAEKAARAALESLAVPQPEAFTHMSREQKDLRNKLRARARQLGDAQDAKGNLSIEHLAQECGYEHWHRMLFARFLAENSLLIPPDLGTPVTLEECKELVEEEARGQKSGGGSGGLWEYAGRCAQTMLPEIFRADDPVLQVPLAREDQLKLEQLLDGLAADVFTASDSLGWSYQFWQTQRKKEVNESEVKIGADEISPVTQLFTEDYMVDFLLDNTLGAWWWGRCAAVQGSRFKVQGCKTEDECRRLIALPGCPWKYLRFVKDEQTGWRPAAGTFDGWPKTLKELTCLDPCMGSGHFVVAMFERLVDLRMAEERLNEVDAVAAVIRDNLFGLEIDPRCTQIAAFNLALAAWRRVGHCALPAMNLACSGLAPNARESDWLKLAGGNEKLQRGMARLYRLFRNAPVLGSLINPRTDEGDLLVAGFRELQPLLERALAQENTDDNAHEMAVTAQGITKAFEILSGQFTLIATNVPYLGRGKQDELLQNYCERVHPESKADLATCFVERCLDFCANFGNIALVTPLHWLLLTTYKNLRENLIQTVQWNCVTWLGPRAFGTISGEVVNVSLVSLSKQSPSNDNLYWGIDVTDGKTIEDKNAGLQTESMHRVLQKDQLGNPDFRIGLEAASRFPLLSKFASGFQGIATGDYSRFGRCFWEVANVAAPWAFQQSTVETTLVYGGREHIFLWENGKGELSRSDQARVQGLEALGKSGIAISQMTELKSTLFSGQHFDNNTSALVVWEQKHLLPVWAFCSSFEYNTAVRRIDKKLNVTNATLAKVPFDLAHWQQVAAEKYPQGLPKPFSSDPTQWLFNGHPAGSDKPLHVAVARLLGYQWPRQTGSSFPDCPALDPDGLEKLADTDGIVCVPSVNREDSAADRLRRLLAAAYGKDWKPGTELELIRATGSNADDFDEWLRNDFFEQHCALFHQRPFLWHIWDGRKRDGFHAIVNYHTLAGPKGRKTLENLTHSYLGAWISRQKDGEKRGEEGAEERLAAALELKQRLEAIIEGEPPYDIFVRWKPLSKQAIGWEPDSNDGVRMNIRPFLASDIPAGKKGAGVLRVKLKIKWEKDRGSEPHRDKKEFPWFWDGKTFTGDRVNDVHLTIEEKRSAKESC